MEIEAGQKSSQLVDEENDLFCVVKFEMDNAEEELVHNGEYVVVRLYSFTKHCFSTFTKLYRGENYHYYC